MSDTRDSEQSGTDFPRERAARLNARLETAVLILEPLEARHADALFPGLADARIYRWIAVRELPQREQERARWQALESRLSPDGKFARLNWAVMRVDGTYVGRFDVEVDQNSNATNVGFVLLPDSWGRGYATQALTALLDHLTQHGIRSFTATAASPNAASRRVLEKAGFEAVGMSTEEEDTVVYRRPGSL